MYPKNKNRRVQPVRQTINWFVLDQSGSMDAIRNETISAYNDYLATLQQGVSEQKVLMGVTMFSDHHRVDVGMAVLLEHMAPLTLETYRPAGYTALYDAIGMSIRAIEGVIRYTGAARVIFTVQTDGQENNSRVFDHGQIFEMIEAKKETGLWTFVFLGADQDAYAASRRVGIPAGNTMSYTSAETQATFQDLGQVTARYARGSVSSTDQFFETQKAPVKEETP